VGGASLWPSMPSIEEGQRLVGTVASYDAKRGYGIIQSSNDGSSVFVQRGDIHTSDRSSRLERGMVVEYSCGVMADGSDAAFTVTVKDGNQIVFENNQEQNAKLGGGPSAGSSKAVRNSNRQHAAVPSKPSAARFTAFMKTLSAKSMAQRQ